VQGRLRRAKRRLARSQFQRVFPRASARGQHSRRPTTQFVSDRAVTLDDFTLFLKGYQQQGTPLSEIEALIGSVPISDAERAAMLAAVSAVPEPAAAALGGIVGLLGLGLSRRRRARAGQTFRCRMSWMR